MEQCCLVALVFLTFIYTKIFATLCHLHIPVLCHLSSDEVLLPPLCRKCCTSIIAEKKKYIQKKIFLHNSVCCSSLYFHSLQSEKDQAEMKELRETAAQQSKTIKRFNRGESTRRNTVRFIKQYMRKETFKQTYQAVI